MKKTYVLQFDYDESGKNLLEVFGVTAEQVMAVKDRYRKDRSDSRSGSLVALLDSGDEIPGGVLALLLANQLSDIPVAPPRRSLGGLAAIMAMMGRDGDLKDMMEHFHDCEHCDGYDECDLPSKKPRGASSDAPSPSGS